MDSLEANANQAVRPIRPDENGSNIGDLFVVAVTPLSDTGEDMPISTELRNFHAQDPKRFQTEDSEAPGKVGATRGRGGRQAVHFGDEAFLAGPRRKVYEAILHPSFDFGIGLIITFNSVTIGVEQHLRMFDENPEDNIFVYVIGILEMSFLIIYTFELLSRFFAQGQVALSDNWVRFDTLLVVSGWFTTLLDAFETGMEGADLVLVLRTARLARLARTVRLLVRFKALWMLVRGLFSSAGTMLYTLLLLVIILYIFSCVGIELITKSKLNDPEHELFDLEYHRIADIYFPDLFVTMLTLVQFVCLDSIGAIYRTLIKSDPIYLIPYFITIILVVPIVLMNLVTAVIVNGAIDQALQDKDAQKIHEAQKQKKLFKQLRDVFRKLDDDGSGEVSLDEIQQITEQDKLILQDLTGVSDPEQIFNALDVDGSGTLEVEEFCDGIWVMIQSTVSPEVQRMEKQVNLIYKSMHARDDEFQQAMQEILSNQAKQKDALGSLKAALKLEDAALDDPMKEQSAFLAKLKKRETSKEGRTRAPTESKSPTETGKAGKPWGKNGASPSRSPTGSKSPVMSPRGDAVAPIPKLDFGGLMFSDTTPEWAIGLMEELRSIRREGVRLQLGGSCPTQKGYAYQHHSPPVPKEEKAVDAASLQKLQSKGVVRNPKTDPALRSSLEKLNDDGDLLMLREERRALCDNLVAAQDALLRVLQVKEVRMWAGGNGEDSQASQSQCSSRPREQSRVQSLESRVQQKVTDKASSMGRDASDHAYNFHSPRIIRQASPKVPMIPAIPPPLTLSSRLTAHSMPFGIESSQPVLAAAEDEASIPAAAPVLRAPT